MVFQPGDAVKVRIRDANHRDRGWYPATILHKAVHHVFLNSGEVEVHGYTVKMPEDNALLFFRNEDVVEETP